jgi:hypothetical protein
MNQGRKILRRAFIPHHQAAEVLQPRVGSFNHPASPVTPQLPPILMRRHLVVPALRDDRLKLPFGQQGSRRLTVITPVGNQKLLLAFAIFHQPSSPHFILFSRSF